MKTRNISFYTVVSMLLFPFGVCAQIDCTLDNVQTDPPPLTIPCSTNIPNQSSSSAYQNTYSQAEYWIPNETTPFKEIKVAVHVFNSAEGTGTIIQDTDPQTNIDDINQLLGWVNNSHFGNNAPPSNPMSGVVDLDHPLISFSLEGAYFYNVQSLHNTCSSYDKFSHIQTNYPSRLEYLPIIIGHPDCGQHALLPYPDWVETGGAGATASSLFGHQRAFIGPSSL